jgi:uncharacterized protein (TIGR02444 family)
LDLSDTKGLGIWDFAVALYAMSGVEGDCLVAQDHYHIDVTALIFALYRAKKCEGFNAHTAHELARTLSAGVVEPLRHARIALKSIPDFADNKDAQALRQRVKAIELDSERLTLEALACLAMEGPTPTGEQALRNMVVASQATCDPALDALLKRLVLAADNL